GTSPQTRSRARSARGSRTRRSRACATTARSLRCRKTSEPSGARSGQTSASWPRRRSRSVRCARRSGARLELGERLPSLERLQPTVARAARVVAEALAGQLDEKLERLVPQAAVEIVEKRDERAQRARAELLDVGGGVRRKVLGCRRIRARQQ